MKKKKKELKHLKKMEKDAGKPAVLLSFDGTVMDTEPAIMATYRHVFAVYKKKVKITADVQKELLSDTADNALKKYFKKDELKEALEEYSSYQQEHLNDLIQPMDGARDFLEWLKKNGYKIGIISSRRRSSIVDLLQRKNMGQYPDVILGHVAEGAKSTRTESILLACELMQAKYGVYITDGNQNILSGQQAGLFTVGFISNPENTQDVFESGPDFLTGSFTEIRKLMEGEPLWLAYAINYPELLEEQKRKQEKKDAKKAEKQKAKEEKKAKKLEKKSKEKKTKKKDKEDKKPKKDKETKKKTKESKKEAVKDTVKKKQKK